MSAIIDRLLASDEPCIRYKTVVNVLGKKPGSLREEVKNSARVTALLSERDAAGEIPLHPYAKWCGAHWVLPILADLGYPAGDESLVPLREQVYGWLLAEDHLRRVKAVNGRWRRCGSQEGSALSALLTLGLDDDRTPRLAEGLMKWQWPDGGWNCDRRPEAAKSSFHETLLPMRALALYAKRLGDRRAKESAMRAADVFLKRRLFKRLRDGEIMCPRFVEFHYPSYWHYDVLAGLKALAEMGLIGDKRCADALDLVESKRLADGGFAAEARFWHTGPRPKTGRSTVKWGVTGRTRMNEFVTVDALYVLRAAGRAI